MNFLHQQRRLLSYVVILAMALALALYLGQDFEGDQLAYHYYAGWSALENRLASDYFAGGAQSYFNPYSHLPFYLMVSNKLAPQLVVAGLTLIHVINLLIIYELAILFNRRQDGAVAWMPVYLALFLAAFNPVFFFELGNTYNEITTSVFVLAGWYLLIRHFSAPRAGWVALAGVLLGVATALKLTNLIFTVTALPLLLLAPVGLNQRGWAMLALALGGLGGLLAAGGWWGWQLWESFGNPFFPLFNQHFQSPYFSDGAVKHYRFLPDTVVGILLKPFSLLLPVAGIHLEWVAPDARYAALLVLLALFGLKWFLIREKVGKWPAGDPFPPFQNGRALLAFGLGLLCTWLLWAFSSGNSRYFLPVAMLSSVALASLLFRFSAKRRFLLYAGAGLVLIQTGLTLQSDKLRWTPVHWGKYWYEVEIPVPLQKQAALYLHIDPLPASFLMPYLPAGSAMMNLTGQYVLEENDKIRALLNKHRGNVRVMRRFLTTAAMTGVPPAGEFNFPLIRFGLEVDTGSCATIVVPAHRRDDALPSRSSYLSCLTRPLTWSAQKNAEYQEKKRRVSALFKQLELMCPRYLQPRGLALEGDGSFFSRAYGNTDMTMHVYGNGLVTLRNTFTNATTIDLGNIAALEKALPSKASFCPDK